jgi:hypothetical protein
MFMIIVLVLMIPILAILMDSSIARAIANRIDRRDPGQPDRLYSERIAYLEGEVERLASDVSRLQDESQFVQKLLTGGTDTPRVSDSAAADSFASTRALTEPPTERDSDG